MNIQVDKSHYDFSRYVRLDRWDSYYQQILETLALKPQNVLLVGVGDGIVVEVLKHLLPNSVIKTLDFDAELNPDYCGSIANLNTILTPPPKNSISSSAAKCWNIYHFLNWIKS